MSASTRPVFVIGSGRCGTRAIYKMLLGTPGVEVFHEYLYTHTQQAAVLRSMGWLTWPEIEDEIRRLYGAAVALSDAGVWIDANQKLSWIINDLRAVFPTAKFVALYRDGRKVVGSFFHKLADEMYDDRSTAALMTWLDGNSPVMPPPEKKYWPRIPQDGEPFAEEFRSWCQFQRICYHWQACNAEIKARLAALPSDAYLELKLEELVSDSAQVARLCEFVGVAPSSDYFEALQTPQHVLFPADFRLNPEQLGQFWEICGPMMEELGYAGREAYAVRY